MSTINDNLTIQGDLRVTGTARFITTTGVNRDDMDIVSLAPHTLPLEDWLIADMSARVGTPGTTNLGLVAGTVGSASPTIQTSDGKATTITQVMRRSVPIPPDYVAGQNLQLRIHVGMLTTVSDGTATIDVSAYKSNEEAGISADLVTTAAQSINSLTAADKDFVITAATLSAGDTLDVKVTIAITDSATGTAVKGIIGATKLLADVQG